MTQPFLSAVILAAGESSRMGRPKQRIPLCGEPVLRRAVRAYAGIADECIAVARERDLPEIREMLGGLPCAVVAGGKTRQASARLGLAAVSPRATHIAVADGARPLTPREDILRTWEAARASGAAALAVRVTDTLKKADAECRIVATVSRDNLWRVQTPQIFSLPLYTRAMEQAAAQGRDYTDDCALVEALGAPVTLVEGGASNIKITSPRDLPLARALLREKGECGMRVGHGYDVHRLVPGRRLVLGGVTVPHETGLLGHSDADVLLHAVADALLGAAGMGDIGRLYPDTDERFRGADSLELLRGVRERLDAAGWAVSNIDGTVIAQRPKLAPYLAAMRENIASACAVPPERVNVKATTEEALGFTGREEGIAAHAVCLLTDKEGSKAIPHDTGPA